MIEVENLRKRYGEKLAAGGPGFVVQPGMIARPDEPTAGRVRVNGRDYRAASAPMAELGILLEAKAKHTGRPARSHLPRFGARPRCRIRSLV
jgi:ABC-2 type transport system ATP-binding protein